MTARAWSVETQPEQFQRVVADILNVDSGCLVFRQSIWSPVDLAFAAGTWLTVSAEADQ